MSEGASTFGTDQTRFYSERLQDLTGKLTEATRESITRKKALREAKARIEELEAAVTDLGKERDTLLTDRDAWKGKAEASPTEAAGRIRELETKLRGREIADKFADHLKELNEGVTLDKMFRAANFDPSADGSEKVDPAELVAKLRQSDAYLFKPAGSTSAAAPASGQQPKASLHVQTPSGRGTPESGSPRMTVRRSDLNDWAFMKQNQSRIAEAQAAGMIDFVD